MAKPVEPGPLPEGVATEHPAEAVISEAEGEAEVETNAKNVKTAMVVRAETRIKATADAKE